MKHGRAQPGNAVVVTEHSLEAIKTAADIVDLGPEGAGGRVGVTLAAKRVLPAKLPRDPPIG
ncbi:hypothetical protein AUC69_04335 [Methyloceanibacter superfactus]|uniref:Uncharacterized protein n=1 Tax=Methyloceanibacter superfactus TaxID=1774969 RepID=A0A1E3VIU2_9HYPH|nr:hypothetical protein [Methyloceanibacter superfactus]ODR93435.1 hypothetical protein AUC69_04335 [Methyloceanibacter superfactus]